MEWIYKKFVFSFDDMTNISKVDRKKLGERAVIVPLILLADTHSKKDDTEKSLFETEDADKLESVCIGANERTTICVSSQAGCALKCAFCATGKMGFKKNLTTAQIIYQVLYFAAKKKKTPTNIVFMGMGEPLLNYGNVMKAIRIMNSYQGFNMSPRRITVSTCGIPSGIRALAKEGLDVNLSISLNASSDSKRNSIMPINKKFGIIELMRAAKYYLEKTNRRITFEYVPIKGINDSIKDAKELSFLLEGLLCHVNLIPYNRVSGIDFEPSTRERIDLFREILLNAGVNATIRRSSGSDLKAACGQLAA